MAYRTRQITTLALAAILLCGTVAGEYTRDTSGAISPALEQADDNKAVTLSALAKVAAEQSQGMGFLVANMPDGQKAVDVRVWEKVELVFEAQRKFANPYTDVDVWVQLKGPNFDKKVYGFWDGGGTFKVRVLADEPGTWTWTSGSNQNDGGLKAKIGSFEAVAWTKAEIEDNPNRRGLVRTNPQSPHGFIYADGTPFFFIADTWWAAMTWRYPFAGGKDIPPSYVPDESNWCFEGGVQWLKRLGFNSVAFIASFPNWTDDNYGRKVTDDNGVVLRQGWPKAPTGETIKNMNDQDGNMPFCFPGKSKGRTDVCADFDRINPAYWQNMDKKMDYLWHNGFVPYIETVRRDHYASWTTYYNFRESFARYLHYIKARYGTYNFIYSLSHNDVRPRSKNDVTVEVFAHYHKKYGPMPFGQPVTAMMAESSLKYLGHVDTAPFLTCHCCGNWKRDHQILAYVREIYDQEPKVPGFNNEPYYSWHDVGFGRPDGERVIPNSDRDNYFARSHAYDNFFSGAFAGHVFGSGSFGGGTKGEPVYSADPKWPKIWQTLRMPNYRQAGYFRNFILSEGPAYQDLLLASDDLSAPRTKAIKMDEWSFMLRSADKKLALLYFENKAARQTISNMLPSREYKAQWYDPRTGQWFDMEAGSLTSDSNGRIELPAFPSGEDAAQKDWAARIKAF